MTADEVVVEGEFAEGAYGPTILLRASSPQGAGRLKTIFDQLAHGESDTAILLEEQPGISLDASLWSLRLQRVPTSQPKRLSRNEDGGFTWIGTPDEWETTAMLVEPLTRQFGHRYLTSEVTDDALIEVSQGESLG